MEVKGKKSNTKLQHERLSRGWSQKKVGLDIGTSKEMVSRWETGERTPSLYYQEQLCTLFGLSTEDLGFLNPPQDEPSSILPPQEVLSHDPQAISSGILTLLQGLGGQSLDTVRRNLLQTIGLVGAELVFSPHFFPFSSYRTYSRVSKESVNHLTAITQHVRAMQCQGDAFIAPAVHAHVMMIQAALEQVSDDTSRRELWRLLAQAQLLVRHQPAQKHELARVKTFNEAAIASAQQSGDTALMGASIGHLGHMYLRAAKNTTKAAQMLTHAQEYVPKNHALNGWFALILASIAAKEGNRQQYEVQRDKAMDAAHHLRQTDVDFYFTDFSVISAQAFSLNSLLDLNLLQHACRQFAELTVSELAENRQASAFYDAARLYTALGDLDVAQNYAMKAIDKALATQQLYVVSRCVSLAQTIQKKDAQEPHAKAIVEYASSVQEEEREFQ